MNWKKKTKPVCHFLPGAGNIFQVGPPHHIKWPAQSSPVTCVRRCNWEMPLGQTPQKPGFRPDEGNSVSQDRKTHQPKPQEGSPKPSGWLRASGQAPIWI